MAEMDIYQVLSHLPHRYPMLLIDRVLECEPGKRLVALKNVTMNEPFFAGHFPGVPIMPGVMMLEAMAQASALLAFRTEGVRAEENSIYYFAGIDGARFKRPVQPGDQLTIEVSIVAVKRGLWKFACVSRVEGQVAVEAEILCTKRPAPRSAA
jgi:3-hydroxyacyl-[acyl-carrier-protein] dehydratase